MKKFILLAMLGMTLGCGKIKTHKTAIHKATIVNKEMGMRYQFAMCEWDEWKLDPPSDIYKWESNKPLEVAVTNAQQWRMDHTYCAPKEAVLGLRLPE